MRKESPSLTRIKIETFVSGNYQDVFNDFNQELFEFLLPPFIKLKRFDGSKKGDEVHLLSSNQWEWISLITEDGEYKNGKYFIDEGKSLFPPLKIWKHTHKVEMYTETKSKIIDEIRYSTGNTLVDVLVFPLLYSQFLLRKPQYKKFFSQKYS